MSWPDAGVSRVPFRIYTDAGIYQQEQERIFRGEAWHYVAMDLEIPNGGDYKANYIGDTPVFATRDPQGEIKVFVNRCAHRGSLLCIDASGNKKDFTCVYHNWSYDFDGKLKSVAFRRGVRGQGGLPEDFDMADHSLHRLRTETINGLIFATFSESVTPLREWLGPRMTSHIERIFNRPVKILGAYVQYFGKDYVGATGEYIEIFNLAHQLNIAFGYLPGKNETDYEVTHSGEIALINPEGDFQGFFKSPTDPQKMLVTFRSVLEARK